MSCTNARLFSTIVLDSHLSSSVVHKCNLSDVVKVVPQERCATAHDVTVSELMFRLSEDETKVIQLVPRQVQKN